ncbi:ATPases of the AAA+ class [Bathymodiolus heckerae thiotrophic gill symbiont]|uniref:ATPase n=1 Tax=Bathymodiolus heckerae thiotrophic gill symbiont TaxID=1052212 RepID=UPI0010BA38FD|nr:ATPase [Bathymodiolus heckerae thiotrophic gill symbiont]CAC9963858.1 ATPases of the AAA+ class [uncultured Gammaproteobacteria bacterium]SHN92088.1 ATPases of the AAA+ class [Bathymodiolus heckerae thiotrophic gill symbiont]
MKLSANEFLNAKHKHLTLLGMSGVGKTHLAKLLSKQEQYFHYSGDYRIGAEYLNSAILDNIITRVKKDTWLKSLLDGESIQIHNNITFDNLSSVSAFLGKVGNPELGGLPIDEFIRRQSLFNQAETNAMLDVPSFMSKAKQQNINNFINDAGGSLCELDDEKVYQTLAEHTVILYIRASKNNESALIERAQTHPKPLYYQADFLQQQLSVYLAENQFTYVAQINPDDFVRWIFPRLLEYRKPKYERIAQQYGYTIDSEDLYQCRSANEVLELIAGALD